MVPVDAFDLAREVGEVRTANVVMVGALSVFLPVEAAIYEEVIADPGAREIPRGEPESVPGRQKGRLQRRM